MATEQQNRRKARAPSMVAPSPAEDTAVPKSPDQLRQALRSRHYSRRTEQAYCHWFKRFICFQHYHDLYPCLEPGR